jgi:four helix bundle protein
MRRAAVSIPANIAEGFKRRGSGEKARFYNIAEASLEELRYYLILSSELGYLSKDHDFNPRTQLLGRMLNRLISAIRCRV